jgi:YqaJ-like viral recombinase domain
VILHDVEQLSDAWWALRRGIPTASEFHKLLTPKTLKLSESSGKYLNQLVGDTFDLHYPRKDSVATAAMRHGTEIEPEARRSFEFDTGLTVRKVGFVTTDDGMVGCSPDGFAGDNEGLEIKGLSPAEHMAYLEPILNGEIAKLPDERRPQVQGCLAVTELKAWWWYAYCPGLPTICVRVELDAYGEALKEALKQFTARRLALLEKVRRLLAPRGAAEEAA